MENLGKAGSISALTPEEAAHAASILDEEPALRPIPSERVTRILVCSPIRKPPAVIAAFLKTLADQRVRIKATIDYLFAPNYADEPGRDGAIQLLQASNGVVWPNEPPQQADYSDGAETRQWSKPAFQRIAALKNRMLRYAVEHSYDFVWLVDADVMCDAYTLQSLLDTANHEAWLANETYNTPIVAGVYWTRWQNPQPDSTDVVHAGPQVWLVHPYQLHGRGWTEADFRGALLERQRVQVWGLGACTLVPRHALVKGVSFSVYPGLPPGPMSEGEDRHFCAWATAKHVPLVADAWPDIYHAYHPSEYPQLPDAVARLARGCARPTLGDLVSAKVELLEPTVDANGRLQRVQPQWVRGKLGVLPVLPQIEEALSELEPGQARLTRLHFPLSWPDPHLRLKSIVARVTLLDAKPWRLPPVVEGEVLAGVTSRRLIDMTQHTQTQLTELMG